MVSIVYNFIVGSKGLYPKALQPFTCLKIESNQTFKNIAKLHCLDFIQNSPSLQHVQIIDHNNSLACFSKLTVLLEYLNFFSLTYILLECFYYKLVSQIVKYCSTVCRYTRHAVTGKTLYHKTKLSANSTITILNKINSC